MQGLQNANHPGQQCGHCHLLGQSSTYYVHSLTWKSHGAQIIPNIYRVLLTKALYIRPVRGHKKYTMTKRCQPQRRAK